MLVNAFGNDPKRGMFSGKKDNTLSSAALRQRRLSRYKAIWPLFDELSLLFGFRWAAFARCSTSALHSGRCSKKGTAHYQLLMGSRVQKEDKCCVKMVAVYQVMLFSRA